LMLHTMHYADEIRPAEEIDHGAKSSVGEAELKLAERLITDLSKDKFDANKFEDTYRQKILKIAEQKAAGQEISVPSAPKRGKVIDLMSALKDSLKSRGEKDASKDSEDEDAQDDRAEDGMGVRRAPQISRQTQRRRRVRS
jgi:DNA end-binding protein Ku